ncbi:DUF4157 domain-containing protein [Halobaculum sp. MBLA0147]|uniref:eCIS core domain-containing protein n=1 Tax=Halobaculum sp. MBLA0147 TaxID=3079934 RepID=UPI003525EF88
METDIVGKLSIAQARERYDTDFEDDGEVRQMMRIEERWGPQVHDWIDEGVPTDAMENHLTLDRFRERRDTPIPWNVEKRNKKSLQRSREATEEIEPAGRTSVPDAVREVISSPGRPLDASIQRAVEERMGDSLGDVRIHTGPRAAAAADAIDARAFTVGNHVAFAAGEYDPESAEGQHVLAHELAHVRQQTGGALSMLPQDDVQLEIDPNPELEREAEETARRVMSGGDIGIQRLSDTEIHVQRQQTGFGPNGEIGTEHFDGEALRDQLEEADVDVEGPDEMDTLLNMLADTGKGSFAVLGAMLGALVGGPPGAGIGAAVGTAGQVAIEGAKSEAERAQGGPEAAIPEESIEQIADLVMRRIDEQTEIDLNLGSSNQRRY